VEDLGDAEEVEELAEEPEAVEELGDAEEAEETEAVEELAGEPEEAEAAKESGDTAGAEDTSKTAATKTPEAAVPPAGGLLAAADKKKTSNIKLAFGDDDIPYIVESSGLELVDEDVDRALDGARADDEPAALEELDEEDIGTLDEAGEPEELEELEEISADQQQGLSPLDIDNIASQIEFSDTVEAKDGDSSLHEDLEIISPFTTMLSNITQEEADTGEENLELPLPFIEETPDNDNPDAEAAGEKKN
jgi:hypothetical protein